MLNFKFNFGVEVKEVHFPITFDKKNICIHCGSEGTLKFVDKFGNETTKEIHPFDHIKCTNCNQNYSIRWNTDPETGKMYPTADELSIKNEFLNIVNLKRIEDKDRIVKLEQK